MEVERIGNTQIIHMEETENHYQVIRLIFMDNPKVEGLALFTRKNGNFLYRDEGDQQKLSKRSINLSGQGHSHFFSLTADNFRYNQNNTLSVKTQLPQRHEQ